ncbi:hypothetical protein Glove_682g60 [Diversispora epigaea]|uniref:Uncharacterized protein n=1 Tax=Diversispora epigaea TaxID=1348612 RepID=A0A397G8G9_9GLOM|nr:hypothetical protein Glove_682g60 [Diversispora epigaea]
MKQQLLELIKLLRFYYIIIIIFQIYFFPPLINCLNKEKELQNIIINKDYVQELQIVTPKRGSYFVVGSTHFILWNYVGTSNIDIFVSIAATVQTPSRNISTTVFKKLTNTYPNHLNFSIDSMWPITATYNVIITSIFNPNITSESGDFYIWAMEEKDKRFVVQCFANILISIMYLNI